MSPALEYSFTFLASSAELAPTVLYFFEFQTYEKHKGWVWHPTAKTTWQFRTSHRACVSNLNGCCYTRHANSPVPHPLLETMSFNYQMHTPSSRWRIIMAYRICSTAYNSSMHHSTHTVGDQPRNAQSSRNDGDIGVTQSSCNTGSTSTPLPSEDDEASSPRSERRTKH